MQDALQHFGWLLPLAYLFGRDIVKGFLRRDAARKLADSDPKNDAIAHLENSAADAIEKLPGIKGK
jgi:hypothetical protein